MRLSVFFLLFIALRVSYAYLIEPPITIPYGVRTEEIWLYPQSGKDININLFYTSADPTDATNPPLPTASLITVKLNEITLTQSFRNDPDTTGATIVNKVYSYEAKRAGQLETNRWIHIASTVSEKVDAGKVASFICTLFVNGIQYDCENKIETNYEYSVFIRIILGKSKHSILN